MKVITVPHPTLRTPAQPVKIVDKKLKKFVAELGQTLKQKNNPQGVGLASPQVNQKWQIFVTQLPVDERDPDFTKIRSFINPRVIDHNHTLTLGDDPKEPILEGCLSIPGFYGVVPRWQKITLEYQEIVNDELRTFQENFSEFAARVIQHEYDHLHGVLFIDYVVAHNLPLYQENKRNEKLYEIDTEFVKALTRPLPDAEK